MLDCLAIVFFCIGLLYLFFPKIIFKINDFLKKALIDDMKVLFYRKKIALIYFIISFLFLVLKLGVENYRKEEPNLRLFNAHRYYHLKKYDKALNECLKILRKEPQNKTAIELIKKIKEKK